MKVSKYDRLIAIHATYNLCSTTTVFAFYSVSLVVTCNS